MSDAEQIVQWAERQAKKPEGRRGHLTDAQKNEIRTAKLAEPGVTNIELAAKFGVNRDTVGHCLKGPEFDALRTELITAIRERARGRLEEAAGGFADDWVRASTAAAEKGDHRPAKEGLQAIGVVEGDRAPAPVQWQVVVGMPGKPISGDNPFELAARFGLPPPSHDAGTGEG